MSRRDQLLGGGAAVGAFKTGSKGVVRVRQNSSCSADAAFAFLEGTFPDCACLARHTFSLPVVGCDFGFPMYLCPAGGSKRPHHRPRESSGLSGAKDKGVGCCGSGVEAAALLHANLSACFQSVLGHWMST